MRGPEQSTTTASRRRRCFPPLFDRSALAPVPLSSYPPSDFGVGQGFLQLRVFALRGAQEMLHAHGLAGVRRQERGIERNVADVAARNVEAGQLVPVQLLRRRVA